MPFGTHSPKSSKRLKSGAVRVDKRLSATNERVWAAGDVTLGPQFVYVAAYGGALVADNALSGAERPLDFSALPGVIFSDPQVATVGLTEQQAREQGREVETSVCSRWRRSQEP